MARIPGTKLYLQHGGGTTVDRKTLTLTACSEAQVVFLPVMDSG